jgi:hypothetical protein
LYKIITETFETYNRCKHKEVAEKLVTISQKLILFYAGMLDAIIEKLDLTLDQLTAFCNGTLTFIKLTNEFVETMKIMTGLDEAEIEAQFNVSEILKKFTDCGNRAKDKLMDETFKNLNMYFKVSFMDLNMESVLQTIFEQLAPIVNALHKSFERKIWKHCLDQVLILYTQSLMNSASKIKAKKLEDILNKINEDLELFTGSFKDVLGNSAIDSSKKVLVELKEFLDSPPEMISIAVITLRKSHGPGFNLSTIKLLMNLRIDVDSKEKNTILQSCKEVLAGYKDGGDAGAKQFKAFFQKIEVEEDQMVDEYDVEEEKGEEEIKQEKAQEIKQEVKAQEEAKGSTRLGLKSYEGWLEKKSPQKFVGWQKRWFSIKNGKLYWYKNERSREAQNSFKISEIIKCESKKLLKFKIHMEDGSKVHKLRAENTEERDKWCQIINELMEDSMNEADGNIKMTTEIFANITGESLFKDKEEEWAGPTQQERDVILNKPKPQKFIQKFDKKLDDKNDPNRRKSVELDKIGTVDTSNQKNKGKGKVNNPVNGSSSASTNGSLNHSNVFEVEDPDHTSKHASGLNCCMPLLIMLGLKPKPKPEDEF